tara:strand:- start:36 stop:347 length:312 start_codon:yes stop_codon:yes gene_type:complete
VVTIYDSGKIDSLPTSIRCLDEPVYSDEAGTCTVIALRQQSVEVVIQSTSARMQFKGHVFADEAIRLKLANILNLCNELIAPEDAVGFFLCQFTPGIYAMAER